MKKALLFIAFAMVVAMVASSCQTGYSKSSYISALEKFVTGVEENWESYTEEDWNKADERMTAFNEKYDEYADEFTAEERRKVSKLMTKYEVIRSKAKVSGFFKGIGEIIDEGLGTVEGVLEGITGSSDGDYENIEK